MSRFASTLGTCLGLSLLFACKPPVVSAASNSATLAPAVAVSAPRLVPASAPEFRYEGRFDTRHAQGPVVIWQGSRIRIDFEGERLALVFNELRGQNAFDVEIDGKVRTVPVQAGSDQRWVYLPPAGPGRHQLSILKRTEAMAGLARFLGIGIEGDAKVFAPANPGYQMRMEFIGDSITAGACNEDGPSDQWENLITHNSAKGYAALVAAAFKAEHHNISVSGMGICTGYVDVLAGQTWDRIYPRVTKPWTSDSKTDLPRGENPQMEFSKWTPDVVFVNLGENDASFTANSKQPFPAGFIQGYVDLVTAVRKAYPTSHIVLLRGGMGGGAKDANLRRAWEQIAAQLEAQDSAIHHFVFGHWALGLGHPRVSDNRAMADELIAWLHWQDFMKVRR